MEFGKELTEMAPQFLKLDWFRVPGIETNKSRKILNDLESPYTFSYLK